MRDLVLAAIIANALLLAIGEHQWWYMHDHHFVANDSIARVVTVIAPLIYYPVIVWRTNGQTPGKMLLHICVVRQNSGNISLALAAGREVGLKFVLVELIALCPIIGAALSGLVVWADILWPLWDRENRALHDMIAGTWVIRVMSQASGSTSSGLVRGYG